MKDTLKLLCIFIIVAIIGCSEDGFSDEDRPISSRNAKLNVKVELCGEQSCQPLSGKIVNLYEFEDEAKGFEEGIRIMATDTAGIATFGFIELPSVFVTVRHDGILNISRVSLPYNSISHHLVTISL